VGSVVTGLKALDGAIDAILLCAVDQPRPASILRCLLDAHAAAGSAITVPVHRHRRGHPLLFDAALLPELLAIDETTLGVRAVLTRDPARVREVVFDDPAVLLDLNTPGELAAS
jgi:molybdenum cofactor cytidylyltransferase